MFGAFSMNPRRALEIQEAHVQHYGHLYPGGVEALREKVSSMTDVSGLHMDVEYDIGLVINARVPRGSSIEYLCNVDFGGE